MHYILLAEGFEEIEMTTPLDILRRGKVDLKTVSITEDKVVVGSHGIKYIADMTASEFETAMKNEKIRLVILPGGMPGTINLDKSELVHRCLDKAVEDGAVICAICAAPMILGKRKMLVGRRAVCYPGYEKYLEGATIIDRKCVTDGNIITATAAGFADQFALATLEKVCSFVVAEEIKNGIRP